MSEQNDKIASGQVVNEIQTSNPVIPYSENTNEFHPAFVDFDISMRCIRELVKHHGYVWGRVIRGDLSGTIARFYPDDPDNIYARVNKHTRGFSGSVQKPKYSFNSSMILQSGSLKFDEKKKNPVVSNYRNSRYWMGIPGRPSVLSSTKKPAKPNYWPIPINPILMETS